MRWSQHHGSTVPAEPASSLPVPPCGWLSDHRCFWHQRHSLFLPAAQTPQLACKGAVLLLEKLKTSVTFSIPPFHFIYPLSKGTNRGVSHLLFLELSAPSLCPWAEVSSPLPLAPFTYLPAKRGVSPSLTLLCGSGRVVNSLDFCLASLKSLGCFYFCCILSSQWKAVTVNLRILHCQL